MMEQIPYACGRLGALAQDIRLRASQLPALREAGDAADLRQIAQSGGAVVGTGLTANSLTESEIDSWLSSNGI